MLRIGPVTLRMLEDDGKLLGVGCLACSRHVYIAPLSLGFPRGQTPTMAETVTTVFPGGKSVCLSHYRTWQKTAGHWSAFALNKWSLSGQACGWFKKTETKTKAMNQPLTACRAMKCRGKTGTCYLYDLH